jgi:hypothetical protein
MGMILPTQIHLPQGSPEYYPVQTKGFAEQFSSEAKKRVQNATECLSNLRCVISNSHELYAVQDAHLLPRAADRNLVSNHRPKLRILTHVRLPNAIIAEKTGIFLGMSYAGSHHDIDGPYSIVRRESY